MTNVRCDVDIDFADRSAILSKLEHIPASRLEKGEYKKHNTGVYLQKIPVNPLTNYASIDYKQAEDRGYFKFDFLNVTVYKDIKDEEHLDRLLNTEPVWELLEQDEFTNLLFHVNGHGDVLRTMKPQSVEQLAMVLAMIRPGKRHLIGKSWQEIEQEIWIKTDDKFSFKKSHSYAYASLIIVQMNLLCEGVSS